MRQANGSPLPANVKFFIWPRYVLSVNGVEVRISRYRARIFMLLISRPGHVFSTKEIGRNIYWDRDDGGALTATDIVPKQIFYLLQDCSTAGIELCLKKPGVHQGYAFMGVGLTEHGILKLENGTAAAEGSLHAKDLEKAKKAKNAKARKAIRIAQRIARHNAAQALQKQRKMSRAIIRYPDTVGNSGGWMFPANYERQHHRMGGKDGAE